MKNLNLSRKNKVLNPSVPQAHRILFGLAAAFMLVLSIAYSIAPAVRAKDLTTSASHNHWFGFFIWLLGFLLTISQIYQVEQKPNTILLPLAALFSGWGLLTIWRITPALGLKQTLWILLSLSIFVAGYKNRAKFYILRKYKYIWLFSGLLLTSSTLLLGTNPNSAGPNLWLGCCGIYIQPSEPLKLLLILYLAAYFADRQPFYNRTIQLIFPTTIIIGLALLLLIVQRDLGTAAIFIFIYTSMVYITTNRKRILLLGLLTIGVASIMGYSLFDVVRLRFEAWLNPWLDASGKSYQIVQSLIAIASGGMTGRGPGMGYPNFVPISFSDFIFSAIAEEFGLPGTLALVLAIIIFMQRGFAVGIYATNKYEQLLAIGLTTYIAAQSLLIIGGNIRLFPLTGVTLPFFSYGGSSLTTTFIALLFLLTIDTNSTSTPPKITNQQSIKFMMLLLTFGLFLTATLNSWWALWKGPDLLNRTDNARRAISNQYSQRGTIYDRNLIPLNDNLGETGSYSRIYNYPEVNPALGYTNIYYGQAGAESSLDPILRGDENPDNWSTWINHLLYGQSPPGFDVIVTLDIKLQKAAAKYLTQTPGAILLITADTGEILVMYSSPYFDANTLEADWEQLSSGRNSPLLNRTTQSMYPPGPTLGLFWMPELRLYENEVSANRPITSTIDKKNILRCIEFVPPTLSWGEFIMAGCPGPLETLARGISEEEIQSFFSKLGFYDVPHIRLPVAQPFQSSLLGNKHTAIIGQSDILVSPLQLALAAAAISNGGVQPAPQFIIYTENTKNERFFYTENFSQNRLFPKSVADQTAYALQPNNIKNWAITSYAITDNQQVLTWHVAGTLPDSNRPLALVIILESDNPELARTISRVLLKLAQD